MSRIHDAVVEEVLQRADGYCEACGGPIGTMAYALHHRHARGRGGAGNRFPWIDTAVNLMVVHGDFARNCHNLSSWSIHSRPGRSRRLGHIVPYGTDPSAVPVLVEPRLQWVTT